MIDIERVAGVRTSVGESPVWDVASGSLWFIDILEHAIHRLGPDDRLTSWTTPSSPGAVAMMTDGRVAVALEEGFRVLDPATGVFGPELSARLRPAERISEGKADRDGRLLAVSSDRGFREPVGHLIRLESDGSTTRLRDGVHLGNGLCFSLDGATLFLADSLTGELFAYDYGEALSGERVIHTSTRPGFPDGATVDADDGIWLVEHHSSHILRLAPDGRVLDRLEMPTPNVASVAFGGPDLDVLYVTSIDPAAFPELPPGARLDDRLEAGLLYRVTGTGARGVAEQPVVPWPQAG